MRRLVSLFLICCLALCLLPLGSAAAASNVCFIATNDSLEQLTYQPYFSGSTIYVPYTVFANFNIYNTYHQGKMCIRDSSSRFWRSRQTSFPAKGRSPRSGPLPWSS